MVKTYKMQTIDVVNCKLESVVKNLILEEDYLKVVEDKEEIKNKYNNLIREYGVWKDSANKRYDRIGELEEKIKEKDEIISRYEKVVLQKEYELLNELKEKDTEINRVNKDLIELNSINLKQKKEISKLKNENYILKDQLEEANYIEESWTLKYVFENSVTGEIKRFEKNGMIKEDAEELIGMDSDNWNHYSLTKEERPDKDKIIEGLIIRSEEAEESIRELVDKCIYLVKEKDRYKNLYYQEQNKNNKHGMEY